VTITDLAQVGPLIAALAEADAIVHGPSWELDAGHVAHDEARRAAAQDARRRAQAYADALGVRLGRLAWASEQGLRQGWPGGATSNTMRAMALAGSGPSDSEVLAVAADEITVPAALEAGYSIAYE
jgi:uncharacterized protein YggE